MLAVLISYNGENIMANKALFQQWFRPGQRWLLLAPLLTILYVVAAQPTHAQDRASPATNQSNPVLIHPASQEFPAVAGQRVVWQDARFGPTDIFIRDLNAAEPVNLTKSSTWEVQPALDGDYIIWKDGYAGIRLHGIDLTTSTIFTVTSGHRNTTPPVVSRGRGVGQQCRQRCGLEYLRLRYCPGNGTRH